MRRILAGLAGALALTLATVTPVLAHPLGNFTINHLSRIEIAGSQLRIHHVLDLAEIPTFQERQRAQTTGYLDAKSRELAAGLHLSLDGRPVPLSLEGHSLDLLPGQGGLQTMRLELLLTAPLQPGSHQAAYRDETYTDHIGWREIVVQASDGGRILASNAPASSISDDLRRYPEDRLSSPLNVTEAHFTFEPGIGAGGPPAVLGGASSGFRTVQDRLTSLVGGSQSLTAIALAGLVALVLGALHALEPGHGKSVMAGYLVGTKGSRRQAVALALTITVTHTAGVFVLGLLVLFAANLITPERLYPWLTLLSGLLILAVGGALLVARVREARHGHSHDDADHHHHGVFGHHHHHDHGSPRPRGKFSILLLGISGGIVPCPSALVVLLAAVSLHRVAFGMGLIVAFSAGLALVLTVIGLALAGGLPHLVRIPRLRQLASHRAARMLPALSALVVVGAGLLITAQAIKGAL